MLMVAWHVLWLGAVSSLSLATWMLGHQVTLMVDLHQAIRGFQLDMVTNKLMGNRVVMTAIFDVIVRANFGSFIFGIQVTLPRQWLSCRFVEFIEQRLAAGAILFHLTLI